jgi:hypothetical protein
LLKKLFVSALGLSLLYIQRQWLWCWWSMGERWYVWEYELLSLSNLPKVIQYTC